MKRELIRGRRGVIAVILVVIGLLTLAGAAIARSESVRWRVAVVALKLRGGVADLGWRELFAMLKEQGGYGLEGLLDGGSVYGAVRNPFVSDHDIAAGGALFQSRCATTCHGADGTGETGPDLARGSLRHGDSDWAIFRAVTRGIPQTAMTGTDMAREEAWHVVSFVRTLQNSRDSSHDVEPGTGDFASVTDERLEGVSRDAGNWLTYSGSYSGQRFSGLDAINRKTVSRMILKWAHQFDSKDEPLESTPIVAGSVMYVSTPDKVLALDTASGKAIWTYQRDLPSDLSIVDQRANRGVAVYGKRVFVGTLDAHLV